MPCRGDLIHFNIGIWPWMAGTMDMDLCEAINNVAKHVWGVLKETEPLIAETMLEAKRVSMGVDEGLPETGFRGGYVGRGAAHLHVDRECIGLTAIVQLFTKWGVGSWLVLPQLKVAFSFECGDIVFMNTHRLTHGTTPPILPEGGDRYVVSLYCDNGVVKAATLSEDGKLTTKKGKKIRVIGNRYIGTSRAEHSKQIKIAMAEADDYLKEGSGE